MACGLLGGTTTICVLPPPPASRVFLDDWPKVKVPHDPQPSCTLPTLLRRRPFGGLTDSPGSRTLIPELDSILLRISPSWDSAEAVSCGQALSFSLRGNRRVPARRSAIGHLAATSVTFVVCSSQSTICAVSPLPPLRQPRSAAVPLCRFRTVRTFTSVVRPISASRSHLGNVFSVR